MINLGDDIEKTGYYQSVKKEVSLKAAKKLLSEGDSIERVAFIIGFRYWGSKKISTKIIIGLYLLVSSFILETGKFFMYQVAQTINSFFG